MTAATAETASAQGPFAALRARVILSVWFGGLLLGILGLGIPCGLLLPQIDKAELGVIFLCFGTIGSGLGALYLVRRLAALGLPAKRLLGPEAPLAPKDLLRILAMNLAFAYGGNLLPHLLSLATGNWRISTGSILGLYPSTSPGAGC